MQKLLKETLRKLARWAGIGGLIRSGIILYRRRRLAADLERDRYFPSDIVLELTNFCNAACRMCPNPALQRTRGFMSRDVFERILADCRRNGPVPQMGFAGVGENLLHPEFCSFARELSGVAKRLVLSTNGLVLPSGWETVVAEVFDDVWISVNAANPADHARLMGTAGDAFSRVLDNISRILTATEGSGRGTTVRLRLTAWDRDFDVAGAARDLARIFGSRISSIEISGGFNWGGAVSRESPEPEPVFPGLDDPCDQPLRHMQIRWDGSIGLCCQDPESVITRLSGKTVLTHSIRRIWMSEAFRRFRRAGVSGKIRSLQPCAACRTLPPVAFDPRVLMASESQMGQSRAVGVEGGLR